MKALQLHRVWLGISLLAIFVMLTSSPALNVARDKAAKDLATVKVARVVTEQNLQQLRNDVTTTRKLSKQIDHAQTEQFLAPIDRLKAVVKLEHEAQRSDLAHFTYTLGPEQRVSVDTDGEAQDLALSTITISADAPQDSDIYDFVDDMRDLLAGRVRLQQLTIARRDDGAAPLAAANVHFDASFEWLSNGTLETVAVTP